MKANKMNEIVLLYEILGNTSIRGSEFWETNEILQFIGALTSAKPLHSQGRGQNDSIEPLFIKVTKNDWSGLW